MHLDANCQCFTKYNLKKKRKMIRIESGSRDRKSDKFNSLMRKIKMTENKNRGEKRKKCRNFLEKTNNQKGSSSGFIANTLISSDHHTGFLQDSGLKTKITMID
ncbi:hypothetical protein CHARACLAT_028849 [Characodon lateralis]|uniref:Uncharacterized protein n=1 Tax=Characodon lateralis TaxID=208331 RepID=A0ABU7CV59_9TELE|nr:hypothetical protein [Characodon lateralis]